MIPRLNTYFLQQHLFHSSATKKKNIGSFLFRSAFKSDNQPGTFKCKRTRCKTCPFLTQSRSQDPIDPLKLLTTLHGPSSHQGNTESCKDYLSTGYSLSFLGSMKAFHSTNLFTNSFHHISPNGKAPPHSNKPTTPHNSSTRSDEGLTLETSAF